MIRYICSYLRSFGVVIKDRICDYIINCRYCFICHSSRLIVGTKLNWNIKPKNYWNFLFYLNSSIFMLRSLLHYLKAFSKKSSHKLLNPEAAVRKWSSLLYNMIDTNVTQIRHKRHECDMSETRATRVRHMCDTKGTWTTRVWLEWKTLVLIRTWVKTYTPCVSYMGNKRLQEEEQF